MGTKDEIRDNLRRLLEKNGIKNTELARRVGVSKAAVSNWLSGKNSIDIDIVPAICDVFGVSIDEFLGHAHNAWYSLSDDERELIQTYRTLNKRDKKVVVNLAQSLSPGSLDRDGRDWLEEAS